MTGSALSEAAKKQQQMKKKEKKLDDAVRGYRAQLAETGTASYTEVAKRFGVNRITLANREQGKHKPMKVFNASKKKLTSAEESVLVDTIILTSRQGIPHTHDDIREEGNVILQSRLGCQSKLGKQWVKNFLCCHNDQLSTYWSTSLPGVRAKAGNRENITAYFALVKERIIDPGIPRECVWAMDKMQANPDGSTTQRVVGESGRRLQHQQALSNKQTIMVLVTIAGDGTSISPTAVFKGKKIAASWQKDNPHKIAYGTRSMRTME